MATSKSTALTPKERQEQLETYKGNIYKVLNDERTLQAFKAAWPNGEVSPQIIATQAFSVIARRPEVLDCEPKSLVATIVEGTLLGLSFLPHLKQAAIVPFKDNGVRKAQLIVEYMGLVKLASNSGVLHYVDAHVVHERDFFDFELGFDPKLSHKPPKTGDRGKPIGVYAVGKLRNGETVFRYLTAEEVLFYKSRSKAAENGPWVTDEPAMWRKTAIRRLVGYLPMDEKTARAAMNDEMVDTGNNQVLAPEFFGGDYIEAEVVPPEKSKTERAKDELKQRKAQGTTPVPQQEPATDAPAEEGGDEPPAEQDPPSTEESNTERMRENVNSALDIMFTRKAQADIAVSEATGGKIQSREALQKADIFVLQQVLNHLKQIAENEG
jgi:recombination protein RecT